MKRQSFSVYPRQTFNYGRKTYEASDVLAVITKEDGEDEHPEDEHCLMRVMGLAIGVAHRSILPVPVVVLEARTGQQGDGE